MEDTQSQIDHRNIPIDCVGIKHLSYPITVMDKARGTQQTVGDIAMSVDLPQQARGTHMSRFVEVLESFQGTMTVHTMEPLMQTMKRALQAERAEMSVKFPYFIEKIAPVSGLKSLMRYDCRFLGTLRSTFDFVLSVSVPVTTLCPCSKAISRESAHNQRTFVTVSVRADTIAWIEDVVSLTEDCASAAVFSLLKREDEKFLTEWAYAHPRFAEDIVREVALRLDAWPDITWYAIASESLESIHAHSAYAFLKRDKRPGAANCPDPLPELSEDSV